MRKWARRVDTSAYRLYDRDIPEIPLILDLYGDCVSGALYKRPYEKDETDESLWLKAMKEAMSEALKIPEDKIFLKTRQRQRGKSQYERFEKKCFQKEIQEGGLYYQVNLSDYLDTGFFLDARKRRALLHSAAEGKRILNLFSYTCSLSVSAAAGGALEVDSVDMSRTYLEWGAVNFNLNSLPYCFMDEREFIDARAKAAERRNGNFHFSSGRSPGSLPAAKARQAPGRFIRADVLHFLEHATAAKISWDLIILDPPVFSNSKKMNANLDIRRDYVNLIRKCLELLTPGGSIWFSVNSRKFHFDVEKFPQLKIEDMGEKLRDEDFKGKKIPCCWMIQGKR